MFKAQAIYTNHDEHRFLCNCVCNSARTAELLESRLLMSVREYSRCADLYVKGTTLILDTPSRDLTLELVDLLNNAICHLS
jgi:hypothetical protein